MNNFNNFCIKGIKANTDQCRAYVDKSIGVITAINPYIGYEMATKVAREALDTGVPIKEIILQKGLLSSATIDKILNPYKINKHVFLTTVKFIIAIIK